MTQTDPNALPASQYDASRINGLLRSELSEFWKCFDRIPLSRDQELRGSLISWFCVFTPELVDDECRTLLHAFYEKAVHQPNHDAEGWYTLDEAENIVGALVENTQAQLVFALACFLGLRPGEIAGLRWSDIDGEWLHVRRSSWRGIVGTTKTPESVASVPLIEPVRSLLAAWRLQSTCDWIFPSNRGNHPLDISGFGKRVIAPLLRSKNVKWNGLYAGRGAATRRQND